jgi:hypothetical protein
MRRRDFIKGLTAFSSLALSWPSAAQGFSHVGAIYATQSLLLQRIYVPTNSDSEIAQQYVAPGESIISVPLATFQQGGAAAIQALIGIPTFSGRCAVVNSSNVVIDHVIADPALYTDPRGQVIPSDQSMVGDTWNGTVFTRPYIELDHTTGLVVAISVQPILTAAPAVNALNYLVIGYVAPNAVIGGTLPIISAKIVARAAAQAVP